MFLKDESKRTKAGKRKMKKREIIVSVALSILIVVLFSIKSCYPNVMKLPIEEKDSLYIVLVLLTIALYAMLRQYKKRGLVLLFVFSLLFIGLMYFIDIHYYNIVALFIPIIVAPISYLLFMVGHEKAQEKKSTENNYHPKNDSTSKKKK